MRKPDDFKLGISIGEMQNHEMFSTGTKHPELAVAQANRYIEKKFGSGIAIFFTDDSNPRRGRKRRRGGD